MSNNGEEKMEVVFVGKRAIKSRHELQKKQKKNISRYWLVHRDSKIRGYNGSHTIKILKKGNRLYNSLPNQPGFFHEAAALLCGEATGESFSRFHQVISR